MGGLQKARNTRNEAGPVPVFKYLPVFSDSLRAADYFKPPLEAIFSRQPFRPLSQQPYPVR